MPELIAASSYAGLFAASFLAATLLPMSSEAAVVAMALAGFNPWTLLGVAGLGNCLGGIVNYGAGRYGRRFILSRWIKPDNHQWQTAERLFTKWGTPMLFFAWTPILGDPLTVVAGAMKINIWIFCAWVFTGKILRYYLLLKFAANGM